MKTPELNPFGYNISAVQNMTGFGNVNFLLAHGTADDNGTCSFSFYAHARDFLTIGDVDTLLLITHHIFLPSPVQFTFKIRLSSSIASRRPRSVATVPSSTQTMTMQLTHTAPTRKSTG